MSSMSAMMPWDISSSLRNSADSRSRVSGVRRSWDTPASSRARSRWDCCSWLVMRLKARFTA